MEPTANPCADLPTSADLREGERLVSTWRGSGPASPERGKALAMLLAATALWGVSFPLSKALGVAQRELLPGANSWFLASVVLALRFGTAAAALAWFSWERVRKATGREARQGIGLGVFAAGGMLLQLDGLNYTAASTAAFLTSCYCVFIPIFVACQRRRWPPAPVAAGCALVVVGMAILAGVDWRTLRLGRGEQEIIFSSVFFGAQILWLERPAFARNRTAPPTVIMFAVMTAVALPVAGLTARAARDFPVALAGTPFIAGLLAALTLLCTLITFTMMNHWQRHLEATEAGLIYCAEPVFTSLFALFLPGWLSALGRLEYADETATWRLLAGGGLITVANICIQFRPRAVTPIR